MKEKFSANSTEIKEWQCRGCEIAGKIMTGGRTQMFEDEEE